MAVQELYSLALLAGGLHASKTDFRTVQSLTVADLERSKLSEKLQGDLSAANNSAVYSCRYSGGVYKVDLAGMRKEGLSSEQFFKAEMGTDFVGGLVSALPEMSCA